MRHSFAHILLERDTHSFVVLSIEQYSYIVTGRIYSAMVPVRCHTLLLHSSMVIPYERRKSPRKEQSNAQARTSTSGAG